MHEFLHLVCPDCLAVNRLPSGRLQQEPKCGKCHRPLFTGHPVELKAGSFDRHLSRSDIPLLVDFTAWCGPCKNDGAGLFASCTNAGACRQVGQSGYRSRTATW